MLLIWLTIKNIDTNYLFKNYLCQKKSIPTGEVSTYLHIFNHINNITLQ